jgi:hypothetical protein
MTTAPQATQATTDLMVAGLLLTPGRKKPGPKGLLKNPRPVEWTDDEGQPIPGPIEVAGHELDNAERQIRKYFREHRGQLVVQAGEASASAVSRLTKLAAEALTETQAAWWSGYAVDHVLDNPAAFRSWNSSILIPVSRPWGRGGRRRHVGPVPPAKVEHKCLWIDTSSRPARLKRYDKHSRSWQVDMELHDSIAGDKITAEKWLANWTRPKSWHLGTKWPRLLLGLREPVMRMLQDKMGRAGKSGRRPAYLACATLATLLDVSPTRMSDILTNYRRRRPKPQQIHR